MRLLFKRTLPAKAVSHLIQYGALAQLGERNAGSVEVNGSIPLGSTNYFNLTGLQALIRCHKFARVQ